MPNTIQLREYSRGGGIDGISHKTPQPERQLLRPLPLLQRWQMELELQLA